MKIILVMAVMAVMACGVSFGAVPTDKPLYESPTPSPVTALQTVMATPAMTVRVVAEGGLRLRSRPDAAGPTDSLELAVMPDGEIFTVYACQEFDGQLWAYGAWHVSRMGWAAAEFLEPNPCK